MIESRWEEALFVDRAAVNPGAPPPPFVALQRVVIRMLFDPAFVAGVYDDTERALGGLDLDPSLVRQLLANDRRLWNADRLRRSRALKILLDEFPVSTTLVLRECRKLSFLDQFFASRWFHDAVQSRSYMALAFVAYIEHRFAAGTLSSPHGLAALTLEAETARARRDARDARRGHDRALRLLVPGPPGPRWLVSPGVRSVFLPGGVLGLVQHIEKYLFLLSQTPALALCDDVPPPDPLPALDTSRKEVYLLEPEPRGKVNVSCIPPSFAYIVAACQQPLADGDLADVLARQGIDAQAAGELAAQLHDAGVLRRVTVDARSRVLAPSPSRTEELA